MQMQNEANLLNEHNKGADYEKGTHVCMDCGETGDVCTANLCAPREKAGKAEKAEKAANPE